VKKKGKRNRKAEGSSLVRTQSQTMRNGEPLGTETSQEGLNEYIAPVCRGGNRGPREIGRCTRRRRGTNRRDRLKGVFLQRVNAPCNPDEPVRRRGEGKK